MTRAGLLALLLLAGCSAPRWEIPAAHAPTLTPFASALSVNPVALGSVSITDPEDVDADLRARQAGDDLADALRRGLEARLRASGGFQAAGGPSIVVRAELPRLFHERRVSPFAWFSPFALVLPVVGHRFEARAVFHAATADGSEEAAFEYDVPTVTWAEGLLWDSGESPGNLLAHRLVDAFARDLARVAVGWPAPGEYRLPRATRAALIGAVARDDAAQVVSLLLEEARRADRPPGQVVASAIVPAQGASPSGALPLFAARRGAPRAFAELMSRLRAEDLACPQPDGQPLGDALERSGVAWAAQRARSERLLLERAAEPLAGARSRAAAAPEDAAAQLALARALVSAREPVAARAAADRVLSLDPRRGEAYVVRASAREQLGDHDAAVADHRDALALLDPEREEWRAVCERRLAALGAR